MTDIALTDIEEKESLSLSRRLDLAAQSLNKAVVGVLAVPYAVTDALNFGSQKLFGTKVYDGPSYEEAQKAGLNILYAPGEALLGSKPVEAQTKAEKDFAAKSDLVADVTVALVPGAAIANVAKAPGLAGSFAKATSAWETTKSAVQPVLGAAGTVGGYAWTGAKVAALPITLPLTHSKSFVLGVSGFDILTDGESSKLIWGGYKGLWDLGKEYTPGVTAAVAEGALKMGDGTANFLKTGAKMGAQGLSQYVPPGLGIGGLVAKWGLGIEDAQAANLDADTSVSTDEQVNGAPSHTQHTLLERTRQLTGSVVDNTGSVVDNADSLDAPDAKPVREMIASYLNMDPAKVNGKLITEKMAQLAKDNPYFGIGMGVGMLTFGTGAGKGIGERAAGAVFGGVVFGVLFQFLGQLWPGMLPGMMRMVAGAPDMLAKIPDAIGLDTSSLNGNFREAVAGRSSTQPTTVPAQEKKDLTSEFSLRGSGNEPVPTITYDKDDFTKDVNLRKMTLAMQ